MKCIRYIFHLEKECYDIPDLFVVGKIILKIMCSTYTQMYVYILNCRKQ